MVAIRAARLFDGVDPSPIERPLVVVENGRIASVATAPPGAAGSGPGAGDTDLGDVTLLPGLVDAHIHLVFDASPDPVGRLATATEDELLDGMRAAARTALAVGVTTVRDLGDQGYLALRLRDELTGDPTAGPEILAAGPPITSTRGHCWFLGGEVDGVDGIRAAVRERAGRGAHVIKVMATGGELTPGTRAHVVQFGLAEMCAAAEEAHRLGLPITAHAHGAAGIANAVAAGFDSIEHCSFLTEDSAAVDEDVLDALARSGVVVSATLGLKPGVSPPPRIAAMMDQLIEVFQRIKAADVPIVCSSDAGIGPPKPHDVLPYAVAQMVEFAYASPVEALRAATSRAADLCRVGDRKGRIAPGYDADLLAVRGNPVDDINALHDVVAVFRAGERVR